MYQYSDSTYVSNGRRMLHPPRAMGSSSAPIDLTGDDRSASKPRQRKRKNAEDGEEKPTKRRKAKAVEADEVKNVKSSKKKDGEKRLKRYRSHAPSAYGDIRHRALTQRMFVVDRERYPPNAEDGELAHPTEVLSIAGTTGNIYTITIDKIPTCNCPYALKGHQCKHIVYTLARVLKTPYDLEYQLAFLSSELRDIFDKAPPLPSQTAEESTKDGNRKPLEGEDCPICCEEFGTENVKERIVYCKASCGNNVHRECFDQWARTKPGNITCPFCRASWEGDEEAVKSVAKTGRVNAEGYVNVASQLGLSGQRDYSTYNEYWVRRQGYDYW